MKYLVYQITNKVNGKIYIGTHKTSKIDDKYMGSGKLIQRAIEKYGIENFEKTILFDTTSSEAMFEIETKLVNKEFIQRQDTYNIKLGGEGGFDFINKNPHLQQKGPLAVIKLLTDEDWKNVFRGKVSEGIKAYWDSLTDEEKAIRIQKHNPPSWKGKRHSNESKTKIGAANSKHMTGSKNHQFGTMWITNGIENRKIKKNETLPRGFVKGRKLK